MTSLPISLLTLQCGFTLSFSFIILLTDFSCAVRARQSSLIQQNNRHTLDHPTRSHPQQVKLNNNPQHGPLFPEASSSSQPYQLQPPPVRQRTVLPQNIQVALSAAVLYQQQQQQQPYLQQAPSTSVRHQAHSMLGNEGHVMDLSPSSVTSLASELSEYSDDSCSKEFTTLTTPMGPVSFNTLIFLLVSYLLPPKTG